MDSLASQIIERDKNTILGTYAPYNVVFERGEGCYLYDTSGKEYLDFLAGIAVCGLGHNNKKIVSTLRKQAQKLMLVSNYFYTEARGLLAQRLIKGTHFSKVFFTNSGAESNETAFKVAKKYFNLNAQGKYKIVTCSNSFHGRTIATVTATGQEKYNKPFAPMPDWFVYVPFNDKKALKEALSDKEVGAFLVECVQGEGGVVPATQEYLAYARKLTKTNNQLLIVDEVQTGIMRTAKMYGYQNYRIKPDIITLAKGLGGGFPIGACLMTEEVAKAMQVGDHGTTYGSNPLACQVALTVVKELTKPKMREHIQHVSQYLFDKLQTLNNYECVKEVRGMGLMVGVELMPSYDVRKVVQTLLDNGLVVSGTGNNTLRLVPPFIVTNQEIDKMFDILENCIKGL